MSPPPCWSCGSTRVGRFLRGCGLQQASVAGGPLSPIPLYHHWGIVGCLCGRSSSSLLVSGVPCCPAGTHLCLRLAGGLWAGHPPPRRPPFPGWAAGGARGLRPGAAAALWWAQSPTVRGGGGSASPACSSTCACGVGAWGSLGPSSSLPDRSVPGVAQSAHGSVPECLAACGRVMPSGVRDFPGGTVQRGLLPGLLPPPRPRLPFARRAVSPALRNCRLLPPPGVQHWLRTRSFPIVGWTIAS